MRLTLVILLALSAALISHGGDQHSGSRWLEGFDNGKEVRLGKDKTDSTLWYVENLGDDFIRLRYCNSPFEKDGNERWLDAANDGQSLTIQPQKFQGTVWKIQKLEEGMIRLRSWNENYREDKSARWLDGASDGKRVKLVNGTTHGTRWKLEEAGDCVRLRSCNNNFK